jgi:TRAP-type C4-dicarboxylate transport system permease small subunit
MEKVGDESLLEILKKIDLGIEKLCKGGLVLSLSVILFFCILNIILRWFDSTLLWVDPLVRHLVFVCAFLGGGLATGRKQHIGIDILSKILEQKNKTGLMKNLKILVSILSFLTLIWLIKAGVSMSSVEFKFGKEAFLGVHSGFLMSIIPAGFIIIAFRFFFLIVQELFVVKEV